MQITFLGAADTVTGSRHLVELGGMRVLLDCGLFQGFKVHRERNWQPLPVPPASIDLVVLSHAHLDHSGWLPVLVRDGFRGPVIATRATRDLAQVLLQDSAQLQEEDARRANRYGWSRHAKALPLYTRRDALRAIDRIRGVPMRQPVQAGAVEITLVPCGHLLGAASVVLRHGRHTLVHSGDIGRQADLLMPAPEAPPQADVLLMESTYGNRTHPVADDTARLGGIVRDAIGRGGSVLLPSFAVGRAQALLCMIQRLKAAGQIPAGLPVFLDSPMAIEATALYRRHRAALRLRPAEVGRLTDGVTMVAKAAQSMRLAARRWPAIIIAASGMATGGRVLHHLKAMAPDPRHHIVFPGFQVGGSRGAHLVAGAGEVKIHGQYVPVRAQVSHLDGLSGHADRDELLAWLGLQRRAPDITYVVHGEPDAADALRLRVQDALGWQVAVPAHGQSVTC